MNGIDYESLENLRLNINDIIDRMVDAASNSKKIINKMDNLDHWDGLGYNSYKEKFSALISNFGEYCNDLYKLNNNIRSSIQRYKNIDKKISGSISNIN